MEPKNVPRLTGGYQKVLDRLGDGEPTTTEEANAVLKNIRNRNGHIDEGFKNFLENSKSPYSDQMLLNCKELRKSKANFTKSMSEQLYSSKYRFLYELIQNADDALYRNALSKSESPFIRFKVTSAAIVIETNEDGFRRANIEAICQTGESSKKAEATDDHIGEKGFGFKSVFAVSEEVHIQSGIWSFRFKHLPGEDGIGMITPLDAPSEKLPLAVTTRITLHLPKLEGTSYEELLGAIENMPMTTTFFLQKLKKIHINVTGPDAAVTETTTKKQNVGLQKMKLVRSQTLGDSRSVDTILFRCFEYVVESMPEDKRREGRPSTVVKLAFPIDSTTSQPKLSQSGQYVFAYLPLRQIQQLQFIIQSDFIASASRQEISDCAWNEAIQKGVAQAFAGAVRDFAAIGDPLEFSWLDYLPVEVKDEQWKTLYNSILEELQGRPVLQSWEQRRFKLPSQLRRVPKLMLYDGKPVLRDLPEELYLAPEYAYRHHSVLSALGTGPAKLDHMVQRLKADLSNPEDSRVRTTEPQDPWHTAFTEMFFSAWKEPTANLLRVRKSLSTLPIIPLNNRNQWAGAPGASSGSLPNIYFSHIGTVPIPNSLGLRLLDEEASTNSKRRAFYEALDVEECSQELVMTKIEEAHRSKDASTYAVSHLQYLFHMCEDPSSIKDWMWVPLEGGGAVKDASILYFPSEADYDMYNLLIPTRRESLRHLAVYLSKTLVDPELNLVNGDGHTWQAWLEEATGARYYPPLIQANGSTDPSLSSELKAVCKHSPLNFLGALKAHWGDYQHDISEVEHDLRNCKMKCTSSERARLETCYLPTTSVTDQVRDLELPSAAFPILLLPKGSINREWQFLEEFGVRSRPDLDFYKQALRKIKELRSDAQLEIAKKVYTAIAGLATGRDQEDLRKLFFESSLIRDPTTNEWNDQTSCVWRGPTFLRSRSVLAPHYGYDPLLETFFTATLGIKDCCAQDVLDELETRSENRDIPTDLAVAGEMYAFLDTESSNVDWQDMEQSFKSEEWILGANDVWCKLEECVWDVPFALSGYEDLKKLYPQLEVFFVRRLNVRKAVPSMLINEISRLVQKSKPQIKKIRRRLIEVGMILARTGIDKDTGVALEKLAKLRFLPKREKDGSCNLVGTEDHFAIPDHTRYAAAFRQSGVLLDIAVEDVQIMDTMLRYMKLDHAYLSVRVSEESSYRDASYDETLTGQLRAKAYALYCCAAKHKSTKALREDDSLFQRLRSVSVNMATLETHLVLNLNNEADPLRVESDRPYVSHKETLNELYIYVPMVQTQRQACYRSQLPKLLANLIGTGFGAHHDIAVILGCDLDKLDDVLFEQDISSVSWIERPELGIIAHYDASSVASTNNHDNQVSSSSTLGLSSPSETTLLGETIECSTVRTSAPYAARRETPSRDHQGNLVDTIPESFLSHASPTKYPRLVEQVARSAQRSAHQYLGIQLDVPSPEDEHGYFDHAETFGLREGNEYMQNRRIGAAGEAYVFELLAALNLPNFSHENWQSTIRSEVSCAQRYATMLPWIGRETADLVYTDRDGRFSDYLGDNCTGDFPTSLCDHDFTSHPIKYYIEVKTTTGPCHSRFFLSAGQYERMQDMRLQEGEEPREVYVIMRVFNIASRVDLKILVDPLSLDEVEFEAQEWIGRTL